MFKEKLIHFMVYRKLYLIIFPENYELKTNVFHRSYY